MQLALSSAAENTIIRGGSGNRNSKFIVPTKDPKGMEQPHTTATTSTLRSRQFWTRGLIIRSARMVFWGCVLWTIASGAAAPTLEEFRTLPDNRIAIRTSFGLRSARPLTDRQVEVVFGLSVSGAVRNPRAYRVLSADDPRYAYEKFVKPTQAVAREEDEGEGPAGSPIPAYRRTVVTLELPEPLKIGCQYTVLAQGVPGLLATGGHTAQSFLFASRTAPAPDTTAVDQAVLGLRRLDPLGPTLLRLEFGPNFATGAAGVLDNYAVRVNGQPVAVVNCGRISKVDTYIPTGWPFPAIPMHEVFLKLARPFSDGDQIAVTVSTNLTHSARAAQFQSRLESQSDRVPDRFARQDRIPGVLAGFVPGTQKRQPPGRDRRAGSGILECGARGRANCDPRTRRGTDEWRGPGV